MRPSAVNTGGTATAMPAMLSLSSSPSRAISAVVSANTVSIPIASDDSVNR